MHVVRDHHSKPRHPQFYYLRTHALAAKSDRHHGRLRSDTAYGRRGVRAAATRAAVTCAAGRAARRTFESVTNGVFVCLFVLFGSIDEWLNCFVSK